jgi:hypothetical protein
MAGVALLGEKQSTAITKQIELTRQNYDDMIIMTLQLKMNKSQCDINSVG